MDLKIKGKTALVLASTRGLGFGVAKALVDEGVNVIICGRERARLDAALDELHKIGGTHVSGIQCDVSQLSDLDKVFGHCESAYGTPDILVYNNGGPPSGDPLNFNPEDFDNAFHAGFHSAVYSMRKALPNMQENQWGRILCITSISVKQPIDNLVLSNATRTALTSYIKTMSRQVAQDGVTINSLLPGPHDTDRLRQLTQSMSVQNNISPDQALHLLTSDIPIGRPGTISEFGSVAAFLCSSLASYITGQAIVHDGGAVRSPI